MPRIEAIGDWVLLGSEDMVAAKGARYVVEFHDDAEGGLLHVDSPGAEGAQCIELHLSWPSSTRGSLLIGAHQRQRRAVQRVTSRPRATPALDLRADRRAVPESANGGFGR